MTQLFDQMAVPDPGDLRLELDELFRTPDLDELDLRRFFVLPPATERARTPRRSPRAWLRAKGPFVVLVVAGVGLGIAAARL